MDKWFPSSKTCSCCGQVRESLSLSERLFRCIAVLRLIEMSTLPSISKRKA
ncbi:zinc ribbon domain-containing protein [Geobacillus subterraneus]|uniref:zinc ribbon domain-containing protein n=1 Tax=Geobacillus subterraneus TaxID=129338 RepID=UPI002AC936DC|nr:zinc ribbon domain-containing protein [Geobacillus subterraneus]WPZ20114.1 zinc ribbon domain-containing protein [Geobacillus subterraneus]